MRASYTHQIALSVLAQRARLAHGHGAARVQEQQVVAPSLLLTHPRTLAALWRASRVAARGVCVSIVTMS